MTLFCGTAAIYGMPSTLLNSPSIDRKPVNKLCRHDRCDHAGIVAMITFGWLLSWWFLLLCYGCSSNVIVRFWQTDWALRLPELLCWSFMNSSLWKWMQGISCFPSDPNVGKHRISSMSSLLFGGHWPFSLLKQSEALLSSFPDRRAKLNRCLRHAEGTDDWKLLQDSWFFIFIPAHPASHSQSDRK